MFMAEMFDTSDFKKGLKVIMNNNPCSIVDFQHVRPGKGAAFTRTKFKNLKTGNVVEYNIKSGEKLEKANVEEKKLQYLYSDNDFCHFMDQDTFDQISLPHSNVADVKGYMVEHGVVKGTFFNNELLTVEVETFVELRVADTSEAVRGDTATGGTKVAKLETGMEIQVPFHINIGDVLRIDTREGVYVDRVSRGEK
jgi:elongation factor P